MKFFKDIVAFLIILAVFSPIIYLFWQAFVFMITAVIYAFLIALLFAWLETR
jgi:predicted PurR-regulated permease PerM